MAFVRSLGLTDVVCDMPTAIDGVVPADAFEQRRDRFAARGLEWGVIENLSPTLYDDIMFGTGARTSVAGTLAADGTPRLVDWNGRRIDAQLEGRILVLQNADTPGVIGRVGTLLGEAGVNVSRMQMGRDRPGGSAVSLWALDGAPPASLLSRLSAIDQADSATVAVLV